MLPIALAEINNRRIKYYLCWAKEITKKVHNNMMNLVKL